MPHLCDNANHHTTNKLCFTTICSLPGAASISSRSSLAIKSVAYKRTKFVVWGRRYSVGNVLLLGKCQVQHELKFGLIHKIICIQEHLYVYFLVKKFNTLGYRSSVNAYLVIERDGSDPRDFSCVTVKSDLLNYHPLDLYIQIADGSVPLVRLRYFVMKIQTISFTPVPRRFIQCSFSFNLSISFLHLLPNP